MINRNTTSFILVFLLLVFFGCKRKYEEGPLISLGTKCARLQNSWRLEYFNIDGVDSTDAIYESLGITDNKFVANFFVDGSDQNCFGNGAITVYINSSTNHSNGLSGLYNLTKGGKYLNMLIIDVDGTSNLSYTPVGPFFTKHIAAYRIKRLTSKDLWLDITYNGKYCWIHFKATS